MSEGTEVWNRRNPLAARAHSQVTYALARGRIHRGPCEFCGQLKAEAHHEDYAKPLEVNWLCRSCHKFADLAGGLHMILPHLGKALSCPPAEAAFVNISTIYPLPKLTAEAYAAWQLRRKCTNPRTLLFLLLSFLKTDIGKVYLDEMSLGDDEARITGVWDSVKRVRAVGRIIGRFYASDSRSEEGSVPR